MSSDVTQALHDTADFSKLIHNSIEKEDSPNNWLYTGVASLLYFIQCNWTGPAVEKRIEWLENRQEEAFKHLSLHDECNTNVKMPELLYFSMIIFSSEALQSTYESTIWWLFRANHLHQLVVNESSGIIYDETERLIQKINDSQLWKGNLYPEILFYLEAAHFYFNYGRVQNSEKYLELALEKANVTLNLEGALGKRTKYQAESKAQLFLRVNVEKDQFPSRCCDDLPKSVDLNDEVQLERIKFTEDIERPQLGAIEEAIVLAK